MFSKLKKWIQLRNLKNERYRFLFDEYFGNELVAFDCETTGLDPKKDEIISLAAVKIRDNQILTSEKLQLFVKPKGEINIDSIKIHHIRACDVSNGITSEEAALRFLDFLGNRPLVGYYLEFDVALINRIIHPLLGVTLPQKMIEVSAIYYDKKIGLIPEGHVDLRLRSILRDLKLPELTQHDALGDAITSALIYLKLTQNQKI